MKIEKREDRKQKKDKDGKSSYAPREAGKKNKDSRLIKAQMLSQVVSE